MAKEGGTEGRSRGKENLATLFRFLPRASREPLSHRLLDACKYPWQRGTTMRSSPVVVNSERIGGWSISLRDRRKKGRCRGKKKERFSFHPYVIPSAFGNFLIDSFVREQMFPARPRDFDAEDSRSRPLVLPFRFERTLDDPSFTEPMHLTRPRCAVSNNRCVSRVRSQRLRTFHWYRCSTSVERYDIKLGGIESVR